MLAPDGCIRNREAESEEKLSWACSSEGPLPCDKTSPWVTPGQVNSETARSPG